MRRFRTASTLCVAAISCFLVGSCATRCHAILIDDFSIDQAGISTNQYAEYDYLAHPDFLGEVRQIWGGGASIPGACEECEIAAKVDGGRFVVIPGNDCPGAGGVTWQGNNGLALDLSGDTGIQITISELIGIAWTRFSIYSHGNHRPLPYVHRVDVFFDSIGDFTIPFSSFSGSIGQLDLHDVNEIVMSTYLDLGEFVAFDSVHTVPEPPMLLIGFTALALVINTRSTIQRRT